MQAIDSHLAIRSLILAFGVQYIREILAKYMRGVNGSWETFLMR